VSLGKTLNAISHFGAKQSTLWWLSLTKDMQTEQLLRWNGMTDTRHTTSGSNEGEVEKEIIKICTW